MKRRVIGLLLTGILLACLLAGCRKSNILHIQVMADTEAGAVMDELIGKYKEKHKNVVMDAVYDSSKSLFERIKDAGEECDVFLTDSPADMDILAVKRFLIDGTRRNLVMKDQEDLTVVYLVAKIVNRDTDIEQSEAVSDFIEYLTTAEAMEIFEQYGFEEYSE